MKIPLFNIDPTYPNNPPAAIRYGIGYDGNYFFQVVTRYSIQGVAFNYCSHMRDIEKWKKFTQYLNGLDVEKRVKLINRVVTRMLRQLYRLDYKIDGVYKFKHGNLFNKSHKWNTKIKEVWQQNF